MLRVPLSLFVYFAATATAYIWPSPQLDALEAIRFDLERGDRIVGLVSPCNFFLFGFNTGRSNAADWIRTAYHDMASHNVEDGTGGMDASIRFQEERERAENAGDGFGFTTGVLTSLTNRYVSLADALALGAIIAIESCGGPNVPFRGGRIDAAEPNKPGVPEPQQDLDSHIASFARQGFTKSEMIGLTACGHTFGGVQHAPFPDIVPELNDPENQQSTGFFDSTAFGFDNKIATEYISGTTQNPLAVGLNDTTNSDKRIFGSDKNLTMQSFADSPDLFASTCSSLFARMLDTVPRGVQLTDVIEPLWVKPDGLRLTLVDGNTLQFSGEVRFWNMTAPSNTTVVQMIYEDHADTKHAIPMLPTSSTPVQHKQGTAMWYAFNFNISTADSQAGIRSMSFSINENDKERIEDQGGVGFAVEDRVVFSNTSCIISTDSSEVAWRLDIGVRNDLPITRVFIVEDVVDNVGRIGVEEIDFPSPPNSNSSSDSNSLAASAYTLFSINTTDLGSTLRTVGAEVREPGGGKKKIAAIGQLSIDGLQRC
ncbi:peroxidase [Favolaschia claudopus]|uniref:Peroxidase n=1 Tax=Favolaschia claudopus TaxID=2862362 RepID=A0AAW0ELT7_9AGAR